MGSFRILEHTADIGIAAQADSWCGLLTQLALGWRQIACGQQPIANHLQRQGLITGQDPEEQMVTLINELIYLAEVEQFVPARIEIVSKDKRNLALTLGGEKLDPGGLRLEREVKSATYHQLQIRREGKEWHAQIFLDL